MKINITGDFFIGVGINEPLNLVDNVKNIFHNSDFNIVNLEPPITEACNRNKILKTGPHINGHSESINILKKLNINLLSLANNHIMDYGVEGLNDTLKLIKEKEIDYIGVGNNLKEATKPYNLLIEGLKIGILNFTENEWSIATDEEPGTSPLNIIDNINQIKETSASNDKVIVIIHGGHEHYHLPSPRMVKQYRFYAENGADVIIGHHTHCIGGYEIYKNVPIFYSLGNFLFTSIKPRFETWFTGIVLQLEISKNENISFEFFPVKQNKITCNLELLEGIEKENVIEDLKKYNEIILDEKLFKESWNDFLNKNSKQYLNGYSPINIFRNKYIRAGLKRLGVNKIILRKQNLKEILNFIRCEAHLDASIDVIKKLLKK